MVFRVIAVSLALAGLPVHAEDDEKKETACRADCRCGDKHPTMDTKGHPHMECDVDVQGISLKILMPDDEDGQAWWPGGVHGNDLPKWLAPQVLPPWGHNSTAPLSLFPLEAGAVVLDLGAGYGIFSLIVAKAFPGVKVIAVEPCGWMAELITENAKRNGVGDRIFVSKVPVTEDGRDVEYFQQFFWPSLGNIYSKALSTEGGHVDERTSVGRKGTKTQTLKELLATEGFDGGVVFANIDCVGCENELLSQISDLDIPLMMQCYAGVKNSKYAGREWADLPSLTHIGEKEGEKCLDVQDLGENKMLWGAADLGYTVEQAIIGLHTLAEGNRSGAIHELAQAVAMTAPLEHLPVGGVREQYVILAEALNNIASFFVASALENGEELEQNQQGATEMYKSIAKSEARLLEADADLSILHEELPMLADVQSGSMFRLGEISSKQGNIEEARHYWEQASQMGHALAAARLDSFPHTDLTGTNGWISGNWKRQLMTQVQMEALGVPSAMHQPLLGTSASAMFDECMRRDQEKNVPRWEDVFAGKGATYETMGGYRFRSWFHSAMGCWLGAE